MISGNYIGIEISSKGNQVLHNYIGTDKTGTRELGNIIGVHVYGDDNDIGGPRPHAGNVIAGNSIGIAVGVVSTGDRGAIGDSASNNRIYGNEIGLGADGSDLGNTVGVQIAGLPFVIEDQPDVGSTFVGGGSAELRNVISGNTSRASSSGIRPTGISSKAISLAPTASALRSGTIKPEC